MPRAAPLQPSVLLQQCPCQLLGDPGNSGLQRGCRLLSAASFAL